MTNDKYSAVWVSHSSIGDFLKCPRAYYIKNIYRNPQTNHKVSLMSPPLALGQAVHEVLEGLSKIPTKERFAEPLLPKFEQVWKKVSGKKGGFFDKETEFNYKNRGVQMLKRVYNNPGPLANLAVKIRMDLPHFYLSKEDNIILCGKVDWLEYLPDSDQVHIVDFKTSKKNKESADSLQLPIYRVLVEKTQKRKVAKASYWYLETDDKPEEKTLPDLETSMQRILKIAKKIKLAREFNKFSCPNGEKGCFACRDLEKIISGEAELVGVNDFGQDLFVVKKEIKQNLDSDIL